MCVPVYLHFHWFFPKPLGRLPSILVVGLYAVGMLAAVAEAFHLLPGNAAMAGLMLAVFGGIILLIVHGLLDPENKYTYRLLVATLIFVTFPIFIVGTLYIIGRPPPTAGYAIPTLILLPIVYFYIIFRQQLGGMELRANRAISLSLFGVIVFSIFLPLALFSNAWFLNKSISLMLVVLLIVIVSLIAIGIYPKFQKFVDRYLLGIRHTATELIENYSSRITTSLEEKQLAHLLKEELFPSLLIREATLLRLEINRDGKTFQYCSPLFTLGIEKNQLPSTDDIPLLLTQGVKPQIQDTQSIGTHQNCGWVRLSIPLVVEEDTVGLCLLGRRDPDDYYHQSDIIALQAIMSQTALALTNIEQANRLRTLYQYDIERQEEERSRLARELHDDVLGQMAMLAQSIEDDQINEKFSEAYRSSVQHVREVIHWLRPSLLNYGLRPALDELLDELSIHEETANNFPSIVMDIPPSQVRYPVEVELHLYRIVQEAFHNAIKHAQASHIYLNGHLQEDNVLLEIKDNGIGFNTNDNENLDEWLKQKQYGLIGMFERASLIGAKIRVTSNLNLGTIVRISWSASNRTSKSLAQTNGETCNGTEDSSSNSR